MDLVDGLDSVEMVDTRIETNLIHDNNPCLLDFSFQLPDGRADVAGGHNVGLALDGSFDDIDVVSVWNERDDEVVFCNSLFKRRGVVYIEGDSCGSWKFCGEGLGALQSTAS